MIREQIVQQNCPSCGMGQFVSIPVITQDPRPMIISSWPNLDQRHVCQNQICGKEWVSVQQPPWVFPEAPPFPVENDTPEYMEAF